MSYLAHELVYGQLNGLSLEAGMLTWQNSTQFMRCQLRRTIETMLSVEYALLFGGELGWRIYPQTERWPNGVVREWGRHGSVDWCSPLSIDFESYVKALDTSGSYGRERARTQDLVMFTANCLTALPDGIEADSIINTEPRILQFSRRFSREKCVYYNEGDAVTSLGLHSLVLYMVQQARELMEAPRELLTLDNPNLLALEKYSTDEWYLGLRLSTLIYHLESINLMDYSAFVVAVLFCAVLFVVLGQYFVLGGQTARMLNSHDGVMSIHRRFVRKAHEVEESLQTMALAQERMLAQKANASKVLANTAASAGSLGDRTGNRTVSPSSVDKEAIG